jgi:hypothetical protein
VNLTLEYPAPTIPKLYTGHDPESFYSPVILRSMSLHDERAVCTFDTPEIKYGRCHRVSKDCVH